MAMVPTKLVMLQQSCIIVSGDRQGRSIRAHRRQGASQPSDIEHAKQTRILNPDRAIRTLF
jgi:hypothetical protein